jgi:hypothetical protein
VDPRWFGFGGIHWRHAHSPGFSAREYGISHITSMLVLLPVPLLWLLLARWDRRKSRLAARGLCKACGYDLRATPDRCPECGAVPTHYAGAT